MIESISASSGASNIAPKGGTANETAPKQTAAEIANVEGVKRQQEPDAKRVAANENTDSVADEVVRNESSAARALSIQRNSDVNRYVYRGLNRSTNEVERQWPTEEALRQMAVFREMVGRVVDDAG